MNLSILLGGYAFFAVDECSSQCDPVEQTKADVFPDRPIGYLAIRAAGSPQVRHSKILFEELEPGVHQFFKMKIAGLQSNLETGRYDLLHAMQ